MTVQEFVSIQGLRKPMTDECGDVNVVGKRGSIYDYDGQSFAVTIFGAPSSVHWNKFRAEFQKCGFRMTQNGEQEGTAVFDPANPEQAATAILAIRTFRKKILSPEHLLKLRKGLSRTHSRDPKNDKLVKSGV